MVAFTTGRVSGNPKPSPHLPPKNAEPLPGNPERGLACSQGITNCIFSFVASKFLYTDAVTKLLLIGKGMQVHLYL